MTVLQMVVIQEWRVKKLPFLILKSLKILNLIKILVGIDPAPSNEIKVENGTGEIIQKRIHSTGQYNLILLIKLIGIDHEIDRREPHYALLKQPAAYCLHHFLTIQCFYDLLGVAGCELCEWFPTGVVVGAHGGCVAVGFD